MKSIPIIVVLFLLITTVFADTRSIKIKSFSNEMIDMPYANSYALLVGVSNYSNGWPDLESIPSEIEHIKVALEEQGFTVETVMDPKGKELFRSFETFISHYGYNPNNRLLFFYSGHGYTTNSGKKGYLVPVDTPNPNINLRGFKRHAMNMGRLITLSREMESKHALFLFDSCFSGVIFKTKALPAKPPYIQKSMSRPVRQYITAGSANEEVPANSTFTPMFIDAIKGKADLNNDGYVTGSELGIHMMQELPLYADQSPQYGKIRDYELSQGDFIFIPKKELSIPKHRLNVKVNPSDASIKIIDHKEIFQQGIKLSQNSYTLEIRRKGYVSKSINIDLFRDRVLHVTLKKIKREKPTGLQLYVQTIPKDAVIRILNIKERFFQGIKLPKGKYSMDVKKVGYQTQKMEIELFKDKVLQVTLKKEPPKIVYYPLLIDTIPEDAHVVVVGDSDHSYRNGMKLEEGEYKILVSKEGYETQELKVTLDKSVALDIELKKREEEKRKRKMFYGF
ncbi:MAG: caspase family protein [Campylobacterota bacterium]|nr:caspase family protein [Campylobacterota bacterium]